MEYYLAKKKNELMTYTKKWIDLENIILSERYQAHRTTYCMISFI
jgi:hypothetical protein